EAAKWNRLAAEQGNVGAQSALAIALQLGWGVPIDHIEAAKWHRAAADQGHADSQSALGLMYLNGEGVRREYVQAHMFITLAISSGVSDPEEARANLERAAVQMTATQIAESRSLISEWAATHIKT